MQFWFHDNSHYDLNVPIYLFKYQRTMHNIKFVFFSILVIYVVIIERIPTNDIILIEQHRQLFK